MPDPSLRAGNEFLSSENGGTHNRFTWGIPAPIGVGFGGGFLYSFSKYVQYDRAGYCAAAGNTSPYSATAYAPGTFLARLHTEPD